MSLYDRYKHLLGLPYEEGDGDCYGLLRRYYNDAYDLQLRNYARPVDFAHCGVNLITENFKAEGFEVVNTSLDRLQVGDGLLIVIGSKIPNHVAAFVGNGYMLHHLYNQVSSAEPFTARWKHRTLNVVRHPAVTEKNAAMEVQVDLLTLLPPHVRQRLQIPAA